MNKLWLYWQYATKVSAKYGLLNSIMVLDERKCRITGAGYSRRLCAEKDAEFQRFLRREFDSLIADWRENSETADEFDDASLAPIWTFWLQGWDSAPVFVRDLSEYAAMHVKKHPLLQLSLRNLSEYIELPGRYYDLLRSTKISPAHFADIVRMNLLKEHGGLWLDASVLLVRDIPEDIFSHTFWTAKGLNPNFQLEARCVDLVKQVTYFMAAKPHSTLYSFVCTFLDEYLGRYEVVLDYLLINHILKIAREELAVVTAEYEAIPDNNVECEMLSAAVDVAHRTGDCTRFTELLRTDTYAFKLSTRGTCALDSDRLSGHSFIVDVLEQCSRDAR